MFIQGQYSYAALYNNLIDTCNLQGGLCKMWIAWLNVWTCEINIIKKRQIRKTVNEGVVKHSSQGSDWESLLLTDLVRTAHSEDSFRMWLDFEEA